MKNTMNIKKKSLVMNNVITVKKAVMSEKDFDEAALALRSAVIEKGLYPTGPIVYQKELLADGMCEYTLYVSVNQAVEIQEKGMVSFIPKLEVKQGLCIRHVSEGDVMESEYILLEECARRNQINLQKPYYHVCMNVYGETIVDVFAAMKEENENDDNV